MILNNSLKNRRLEYSTSKQSTRSLSRMSITAQVIKLVRRDGTSVHSRCRMPYAWSLRTLHLGISKVVQGKFISRSWNEVAEVDYIERAQDCHVVRGHGGLNVGKRSLGSAKFEAYCSASSKPTRICTAPFE